MAKQSAMKMTFKRCEHLKRPADFAAVFKGGRHRSVPGAQLIYLPNSLPHHRVGFAMRRGYGTAVERNRCKRLSREAWRLLPKDRSLSVFSPHNGEKSGSPSAPKACIEVRNDHDEGSVHYDVVLLVKSKGDTLADRQRQLAILCRGIL